MSRPEDTAKASAACSSLSRLDTELKLMVSWLGIRVDASWHLESPSCSMWQISLFIAIYCLREGLENWQYSAVAKDWTF